MLFSGAKQKELFEAAKLRAQTEWDELLVTEIVPLTAFYPAEEEHQDYFSKNPEAGYCRVVIAPKVIKTRKEYTRWFKEES